MIAFEIIFNGNRICLAGIESEKGTFATHIISTTGLDNQPDSISLDVSGLNSASNEHQKWLSEMLHVGDEILVRIIDSEKVDQPSSVSTSLDQEAILNSKLKTYYQLKKELAEHLEE